MKVKKLILFAAAAAMFAACSDDGLTKQTAEQTSQGNAVSFEAYMQRATTRAGVAGDASYTALTTGDMKDAGFGVFGYYTDNFDYTPLYQPNFMYNEQVTFDGTNFTYPLTKYWPNEHGSAATSADMDRISFFAYLPYVETDPATGMLVDGIGNVIPGDDEKMQYGITGMKRNSLQGDPTIQYVASFDQANCVDLCWGTTGSSDITWNTNGSSQTIKKGFPWLNVRKPDGVVGTDSKVKFTFRHALAKLTVNVQTDFTGGWENTDATKTKVWVRSIRFTGIAQKAALNLNNPKANIARWVDYYGTNEMEMGESVTVYDGRKDGSEGVDGAEAINEAVLGLNPAIVQVEGQIAAGAWLTSGASVQPGVTTTPTKLFRKGNEPATAVYVIPTGEKVNVEIVYDIETIDPKLPTTLSDGETHGSTIENRIIKQAVFNKLESGKSYTLNLKLGMKDVQFDATVNDSWETGETSDAYLPNNMAPISGGAGSPDPVITIPVPYNVTNLGNLTVSGLTPSEDYSGKVTKDETLVTAATGSTADASGNMIISGITLAAANTTVSKQVGSITVDASGSEKTVIKIERAAKPFVLGLTAITVGTSFDITANTSEGGSVESAQWTAAISTVAIQKYNETTGNWDTLESPTNYSCALNSGGTGITVTMTTTNGEKYILTVKVGDAPAVTKEFTVGS